MRIPHWDYLSWARDRFGAARALYHYPPAFFGDRTVRVGGVYLRPGKADENGEIDLSDFDVHDTVFKKREYEVDIPEPRLIVDAGAHIGLASVWFAKRYPKARIIALEPDAENFRMLVKNTRGLNVEPLQCGLWSSDTSLRIVNTGAARWSFRVVEDIHGTIEGVSMDWLRRKFGKVDCLKMDIEGSETAVLMNSRGWIDTIDSLIVELHDKEPGAHACMDALKYAIDERRWKHSVSGESQVLVRIRE